LTNVGRRRRRRRRNLAIESLGISRRKWPRQKHEKIAKTEKLCFFPMSAYQDASVEHNKLNLGGGLG
jgi:hypothetical protein